MGLWFPVSADPAHQPHNSIPEVCMSESGLKTIGVIGIGTMGNGIAQVAAQSGFDTRVMDVSDEVLERGMTNIGRSLDRLVKAYEKSEGKKGITAGQKAEAVARISTTTALSELLDRDIIIEAAPEAQTIPSGQEVTLSYRCRATAQLGNAELKFTAARFDTS